MKRRHHDWTGRELAVSRLESGARVVVSSDGTPQNEDTLTFRDPFEGGPVTGTVRLATGFFDAEADAFVYRFTVDLRP